MYLKRIFHKRPNHIKRGVRVSSNQYRVVPSVSKMVSKTAITVGVAVALLGVICAAKALRLPYYDLEVAGSGKHEEWKHGGGKDHHSDDHSSKGEKGEKGYKGSHGYEKGEKGHHDKEGHKGQYGEEEGYKKKHYDDGGYHHESDKGEKGEKGHKYEEKGSFSKGHSTKGKHEIHKVDEFKKDKKFYDEDHDEGFEEKHGDFHEDHGYKKGGSHKKGHHHSGHHHDEYGKKGSHKKGHHHHDHSGHKGEKGHDDHHSHKSEYGKKGGSDHHKKFGHSKGHKH